MTIAPATIEKNLRLHVDRLAGLIGPRTLSKPKTIQATIGYIEGQWSEMEYSHSRECHDAMGDEATNLIVECPGTKRADEIVLLGAHYDTVFSTPGADDNASAVAVLIEVSRLLREHTGNPPTNTLPIVWCDGGGCLSIEKSASAERNRLVFGEIV